MIDQFSPDLICLGAIVAVCAVAALFAFKPAWGCGGVIAIIGLLVLGLTTNGLVAIGGAIVCAIVFIFVKFGQNGMNVNIENSGDNVNITVNK